MLPSQMIPKQPCQCNPSWLLDAKHAILIFSTHSSSVFMPSYAFKWIFLIFISCLSFLKAPKLYERCKRMQKKCFKRPFFHETTLCLFNLPFLLSKQHQFSFLYITHTQKKQGSPNSNILDWIKMKGHFEVYLTWRPSDTLSSRGGHTDVEKNVYVFSRTIDWAHELSA